MGGPSINPIEPLLHILCSNRDAARSDASAVSKRERADAMLSIVGRPVIMILLYVFCVVWCMCDVAITLDDATRGETA